VNRSYNTVSNKETILTVIFKRLRSLIGKENIFLIYYNLPLISNFFCSPGKRENAVEILELSNFDTNSNEEENVFCREQSFSTIDLSDYNCGRCKKIFNKQSELDNHIIQSHSDLVKDIFSVNSVKIPSAPPLQI